MAFKQALVQTTLQHQLKQEIDTLVTAMFYQLLPPGRTQKQT